MLFVAPVGSSGSAALLLNVVWGKIDFLGGSGMPVSVREIRGYNWAKHSLGRSSIFLARYVGEGVAKPAYDVVSLGLWK